MSCVCGMAFLCGSTLVKVPLLQAGTVVIWPQMFKSDVKPKQTVYCALFQDPTSPSSISMQIPTDGMLRQIAEKATRRDWHMLANRLGFTAEDIASFEERNPQDGTEQVCFLYLLCIFSNITCYIWLSGKTKFYFHLPWNWNDVCILPFKCLLVTLILTCLLYSQFWNYHQFWKLLFFQIYDMLKSWRDREGTRAFGHLLEKALQNSGMNDIALLLQP